MPDCVPCPALRNETLESGQLKQCFMRLLTSVLPLLGLPSYNGIEEEDQPVAASPIAYAAKDCLQAACNLLGPSAYLGAAAQLFLSSTATGKEAVHLAEVPCSKLPHSEQLQRRTLPCYLSSSCIAACSGMLSMQCL